MSVYVGPWVLGLALLQKDVWHNLVDLGHQLEEWVVGQMFQSKFTLTCVPRVGLPQHGMSVAWDNLRGNETITYFQSNAILAEITFRKTDTLQ